jgi:uncharacterized protein
MTTEQVRTAPVVTDRTEAYWTGGARGELLIARCQSCGWWLHPPLPVCPRCRSREVRPEPVSGRGTVWSTTVSRMAWSPALTPPYAVSEIELVEQAGLRVLSTVVGIDPVDVRIGLDVSVAFEPAGDTWVPVFVPVANNQSIAPDPPKIGIKRT